MRTENFQNKWPRSLILTHCQSFLLHFYSENIESQEGKGKGLRGRREVISERLRENKTNGKKEEGSL